MEEKLAICHLVRRFNLFTGPDSEVKRKARFIFIISADSSMKLCGKEACFERKIVKYLFLLQNFLANYSEHLNIFLSFFNVI